MQLAQRAPRVSVYAHVHTRVSCVYYKNAECASIGTVPNGMIYFYPAKLCGASWIMHLVIYSTFGLSAFQIAQIELSLNFAKDYINYA